MLAGGRFFFVIDVKHKIATRSVLKVSIYNIFVEFI